MGTEHSEERAEGESVHEVRAEIVANVWKQVAAVGDVVDEDDVLMVMESMKMEIPVIAGCRGTLASFAVGEGAVVQEGDLLATVVEASA